MRLDSVVCVPFACAALALAAPAARAQHVHPAPEPAASPAPAVASAEAEQVRPSAASPTLFQSDMAAMTGMAAGAAPHGTGAGWSAMAMGLVRLQYNHQGGPSGDTVLESTNWSMVMAQRPWLSGTFTAMMMNSLEPATFHDGGMPQIFQTGETFEGRPLVDRQHPHDLFMNLSVTWRRPIGAGGGAAWVQVAPVGEPALGPTAFMHRASSGENPAAPLGHHWEDSSHITRSVITAGGAWRRFVLEGSTFHGKEPDEGRWDIDGGAPDSFSARLKVRLGRGWSGQVSHAFLEDPETLSAGDARRTTASLHYGADGARPIAASLIWGQNREVHGISDAVLAEAAWQITARDQLYGRAEYVEKESELLLNKGVSERDQHGHEHGFAAVVRPTAPIGALTVGYLRNMDLVGSLNAGLGGDVTVYQFGASLRAAYGDMPVSTHVFVRLRWGRPHGGGQHHH
jgi:hypothetical protein